MDSTYCQSIRSIPFFPDLNISLHYTYRSVLIRRFNSVYCFFLVSIQTAERTKRKISYSHWSWTSCESGSILFSAGLIIFHWNLTSLCLQSHIRKGMTNTELLNKGNHENSLLMDHPLIPPKKESTLSLLQSHPAQQRPGWSCLPSAWTEQKSCRVRYSNAAFFSLIAG